MTRAAGGGAAIPFGPPDIAVAIAMNVAWGLNIIAIKVAVGALAPFAAGAVRMIAVGLICAPWLRSPAGRARILPLFGLLTGGLFPMLMNLALKAATNVGALAIAGQLSVPIGIVLGAIVLRERMGWKQVAGVVLAFGGIVLLLFDPRIFGERLGLALMIGAAATWGVSSLIQRQLAGVPILTLYAWSGLMGAALMLSLSLALEPGVLAMVTGLSAAPILWLAFSVFGATLGAQGGMAWLLRRHPMSAVMPLTLGSPVVSVVVAHLMFGTPVTASMLVGGLVALGGIVLVTLARRQALEKAGV